MNVEWATVSNYLKAKIIESQRVLETCPMEEVERVRGRLQAYRQILRLPEENNPLNQ